MRSFIGAVVLAAWMVSASAHAVPGVLILDFFGDSSGRLRQQLLLDLPGPYEERALLRARYEHAAREHGSRLARTLAFPDTLSRVAGELDFNFAVGGRVSGDSVTLRIYDVDVHEVLRKRLRLRNGVLPPRELRRVSGLLGSQGVPAEGGDAQPGPPPTTEPSPLEVPTVNSRPTEPSPPGVHAEPVMPPAPPVASVPAANVAPLPAPGPVSPLETAFHARRTAQRPHIDGRLSEPAWALAPVFNDFLQTHPEPTAGPSQRTEVRVLYDDERLYVGVTCLDNDPGAIVARLGRRDSPPPSDSVEVMVDSALDRRTAYSFALNAAGVQQDSLRFEDVEVSTDWDAVWDGASARLPNGWSAEFSIPLSILRFPERVQQRWGFNVRRQIARLREVDDAAAIPWNGNALVSRFNLLTGLVAVRPQRAFQLAPFVAARETLRPQFSDPTRPHPREAFTTGDVGLDFKTSLTSQLALTGTVNPDFGQVEADQIIINLSTTEAFFPEKRPFFLQGMEQFQREASQQGTSNEQLFYSRRIGLKTPILGAVKVAGAITPGLEIGLLDAVTANPAAVSPAPDGEVDPSLRDRRYRFHNLRPLHLGPEFELPTVAAPTTNFLVANLYGQPSEQLSLGGTFTSADPLTGTCDANELSDAAAVNATSAPCKPRGGRAAALHWNLRTASGNWVWLGKLIGSEVTGGPEGGRRLIDGTVLRPGALGNGIFTRAGKLGGEPFRFNLSYERVSPTLDIRAVGYQPRQNFQMATAKATLALPSGAGSLREMFISLNGYKTWSTDGRAIPIEHQLWVNTHLVFKGFESLDFEGGVKAGRHDPREIEGTGVVLQRPSYLFLDGVFATDERRALSLSISATLGVLLTDIPSHRRPGGDTDVALTWRPVPFLQTELLGHGEMYIDGPRYLSERSPGSFLFADQDARFVSGTLRQLWVFTPRLTLQLYAQLFTGSVRYGAAWEGTGDPRHTVTLASLTPAPLGEDPSFRVASLNLNGVLRWEYQPGATLFAVYSRSQDAFPSVPPIRTTLLPQALWRGPATDTFLIKWSYFWGN